MEIKTVKRKVSDLKPDPNQPRKIFKEDSINKLASTIQLQGIINPIEIDKDNIIITGEIRWKASKLAKLEEIECKQLFGLNDIERFERQTIENVHHNTLKDEELQRALERLWKSKNYISIEELAKRIGLSEKWVKDLIRLPEAKKEIGLGEAPPLKTSVIAEIDRKLNNKEDKQKIAKKAINENLTRDQVRDIIKTVKKLPKEIKNEVLKKDSKITLNEAKDIAIMPTIELRKEAMKVVQKQKNDQKETMEYMQNVANGKIKGSEKTIDLDQKIIEQFNQLYRQIVVKMNTRLIKAYNQPTQMRLLKIMKETLQYLQKELNIKGEIIDITS